MKHEPRALELIKTWNGKTVPTFPQVLQAYRLAMRRIQSHDGALALIKTWIMLGTPGDFAAVLRHYANAIETVEETDTEEFFRREVEPAIERTVVERTLARHPPMPPVMKTPGPPAHLTTNYLDGAYRQNHPGAK